ncbi:hypothetical protein QJS04_geneDACA017109 [Acorus gramineus]|uniref:Uncharacterized protein n=1 Tax=Acorus gramineus TaxID=55184 RepID=A0AAV9AUC3_ACOGR|nr:hypothetical protein QJS04_geneDACA017109 [Acorus gramineus]
MGRVVSRPPIPTTEEVVKLVHSTLKLNPLAIADELKLHNGRSVRLSWLRDNLAKRMRKMPTHSVEHGCMSTFCHSDLRMETMSMMNYLGPPHGRDVEITRIAKE